MKQRSVFVGWFVLGLSLGAGAAQAGDARACIIADGQSLVNQCRSVVDVVWCADLSDGSETCARGFTSSVNLQPGGRYSMNPLGLGAQVLRYHVGACLGADSLAATTEQLRLLRFDCR